MCFSLLRLDGFGFKVTSMDILTYTKPELLILIPVLSIVGRGIKKSKVKNNRIPLILGVIAIFLSTLWVFSTSDIRNWQDAVNAVYIGKNGWFEFALEQCFLALSLLVFLAKWYLAALNKLLNYLKIKCLRVIEFLKSKYLG